MFVSDSGEHTHFKELMAGGPDLNDMVLGKMEHSHGFSVRVWENKGQVVNEPWLGPISDWVQWASELT